MSQSTVAEHEIVRDARRPVQQKPADAKALSRSPQTEAPVVERVRNVGGRLMA